MTKIVFWIFLTLVSCGALGAPNGTIYELNEGYKIELSANSGEVAYAIFPKTSRFDQTNFSFRIKNSYENNDWPPGMVLSLINSEAEYTTTLSLLKINTSENYTFVSEIWVRNEKYPVPFELDTGFIQEVNFDVELKISTDKITYKITGSEPIEIPLALEVDKIRMGMQSAEGEIYVHLPNE